MDLSKKGKIRVLIKWTSNKRLKCSNHLDRNRVPKIYNRLNKELNGWF